VLGRFGIAEPLAATETIAGGLDPHPLDETVPRVGACRPQVFVGDVAYRRPGARVVGSIQPALTQVGVEHAA
jgi:hypothetical protein